MFQRFDRAKRQTDASFALLLPFDDRVFPNGVRSPAENEQRARAKVQIFRFLRFVVFQTQNPFGTERQRDHTGIIHEISRLVEMKPNVIVVI